MPIFAAFSVLWFAWYDAVFFGRWGLSDREIAAAERASKEAGGR